ncbi:MAG: hypothetical protein AAB877_01375 [Patescibacteria group bacterium]
MDRNIGEWKIAKWQIAEIRELYQKLGWSVEEIENNLQRKLEDFFWVQANSVISGAKLFLND